MAIQIYGDGLGTASAGDNTITHYYDKAGIKAANAISVYAQFADRRSMPLKMGKTYKVSKWLHIFDRPLDSTFSNGYLNSRDITDVTTGLSDASLSEGAGAVNPVGITKVTISESFSRYGEMIDYTDEVDLFSEDAIQVHYREELGLLANRRAEDLIQLDMLTSTNVMYVGTAVDMVQVGQDTDSDTYLDDDKSRISYDMIRKGVRRLIRNRAMKNTSIVTGSTKIDTRVINKAFYAIIGPEVKYDLEMVVKGEASTSTAEFAYVPAYKYADATNIAEGEVGAMNDVRFIESESAVVYSGKGAVTSPDAASDNYTGELATSTYSTAAEVVTARGTVYGRTENVEGTEGATSTAALVYFDVFPILFPTKGSFATIGLKGNGKIKFNSQAPGKIELGNPYGTKGFFSYNMWYAGIILREERLLKMLVCASR